MGASAALGRKGHKQFQLSLIIFYIAESKEFKKNAPNTLNKLKETICAYKTYTQKSPALHTTTQHCFSTFWWSTVRWSPCCSVCAVKRDQEHNYWGRQEAGESSFYKRVWLMLLKFYIMFSAVNVFQFRLQKGSCLKKHFTLHSCPGLFVSSYLSYFCHLGIFRIQKPQFSSFFGNKPIFPNTQQCYLHFLFQKRNFPFWSP